MPAISLPDQLRRFFRLTRLLVIVYVSTFTTGLHYATLGGPVDAGDNSQLQLPISAVGYRAVRYGAIAGPAMAGLTLPQFFADGGIHRMYGFH